MEDHWVIFIFIFIHYFYFLVIFTNLLKWYLMCFLFELFICISWNSQCISEFSFKLRSFWYYIHAISIKLYKPVLISLVLAGTVKYLFKKLIPDLKMWFIWYIKLFVWVTSNFPSLAFGKYFAICNLTRTCVYMGFPDLESAQTGASCGTYII